MSPDENRNTSSVMGGICEVYIWGSNSSHQLGEGSQEKVIIPKLTTAFGDCQQVHLVYKNNFSNIFQTF